MVQTPEQRKEKARWSRILKVYGLTKERYELLDLGHCPICLRNWGDGVQPVIDHDHVQKIVRGVVCRYCNHRRIGDHRDPDIVFRIYQYLLGPFTDQVMPKASKKKKRKKRAS